MKVETVAEQLAFVTLRIQTSSSVGTGFIMCYKWRDKETQEELTGFFLVTNKHVFAGSSQGTLTMTRKLDDSPDITLGDLHEIGVEPTLWKWWFGHPSDDIDVAALPLNPIFNALGDVSNTLYFKHLSEKDIPPLEKLDQLNALEEVIFIGYPNNVYDRENNLPLFRKGITASPANVDYNGKPVFLIDASVFPGSSGSPVFVYNAGAWRERSGFVVGNERLVFLGILSSVLFMQSDGTLEFVEIPAGLTPIVKTREMIDLGIVYKARTVLETIEHGLRRSGQMV